MKKLLFLFLAPIILHGQQQQRPMPATLQSILHYRFPYSYKKAVINAIKKANVIAKIIEDHHLDNLPVDESFLPTVDATLLEQFFLRRNLRRTAENAAQQLAAQERIVVQELTTLLNQFSVIAKYYVNDHTNELFSHFTNENNAYPSWRINPYTRLQFWASLAGIQARRQNWAATENSASNGVAAAPVQQYTIPDTYSQALTNAVAAAEHRTNIANNRFKYLMYLQLPAVLLAGAAIKLNYTHEWPLIPFCCITGLTLLIPSLTMWLRYRRPLREAGTAANTAIRELFQQERNALQQVTTECQARNQDPEAVRNATRKEMHADLFLACHNQCTQNYIKQTMRAIANRN